MNAPMGLTVEGDIQDVTFSTYGTWIGIIFDGGEMCVYDSETGLMTSTMQCQTICAAALSPDGSRFASVHGVCNNLEVQFWDIGTGHTAHQPLRGHTNFLKGVVYSSDGNHLLSFSLDGTICVWNASVTITNDNTVPQNSSIITKVAFSPDGTQYPFFSDDGQQGFCNITSGNTTSTLVGAFGSATQSFPIISIHKKHVAAQVYPILRMWNIETLAPVTTPTVQ
jgi:WD40 repeat protein